MRKTGLPKKVKIGPFKYTVEHLMELRDADDINRLHGRHNGTYKTIEVWARQAEDMKKETFIHECLHGIIDIAGLDLKGMEEGVVTALSPVIMMWMKDNPKAMEWIIKDAG